MFIKIIKNIFILSIIFYFVCFIYLKFKHPFWFSQPVSQYTDLFQNEGIIQNFIPKPINIEGYKIDVINTKNKKNIQNIAKLLNENYNIDDSYRFNYDENYLNWSINTPYQHYNIQSNNKWSLGIYDKGILIAFINGKPIDLYFNNKNLPCFYVDYLCIDKKYRKHNLAQGIITQMANNGFVDYFKLFIFKKELFPLPFKFVSKYNYYIIETKKIKSNDDNLIKVNYKNINDDKIIEFYNFYCQNIVKHKLYNKFHYSEFKHYFNNNSVSFYSNKKGNTDILVGIYDSKVNYNNTKTSDFLFIIINNKNIYGKIIDEIIFKESQKYNYSLINDMSHSKIYIESNKLEKISQCFLHFYNYYTDKKIDPEDLSLNIP